MEEQLLTLYAQLKKEAERCNIYSMRAKMDGETGLSLLFQALAVSHDMQAQRFLVQLRGSIGKTDTNRQTAFDREIPGLIELYERMLAEVKELGNKALETGFMHSRAVQKKSLRLHALLEKQEEVAAYHVCNFCGYIASKDAPEYCPVCTAPKKRFIRVAADL